MTGRRAVRGVRPLLSAVLAFAGGVLCVRAETLSLSTEAGRDYRAALVAPTVSGAGETASLTLSATDPVTGTSVAEGLPVGLLSHTFENLTAGSAVALDGYVVDGGATNAASHELFLLGRFHNADEPESGNWNDHWLYETVDTYTNGTGTGVWSGKAYAAATNGLIAIDTSETLDTSARVICRVGVIPTPRRGCVVAAELTFPAPHADLPDPAGERVGLTTVVPDEAQPDVANFTYLENGVWRLVPVAVLDPLASTNWSVRVAIDLDAQTATYYARASETAAWTVLGRASGVGAESFEEVSFRGTGEVRSLEGHGFDTHLLKFEVAFDAWNLHPGCNFEETVVTGRVTSSIVHDTSLAGGAYAVRLTDLAGNVVETRDFTYTAEGTFEFHVAASNLTAGAAYQAEVVPVGSAEVDVDVAAAWQSAVMGAVVSNASWALTNVWMYENAETFDARAPGSGVWYGTNYAVTAGGWIDVNTFREMTVPVETTTLQFEPTNVIEDAYSTLVAGIRAVFTEACFSPDETTAAFGFTLSAVDDALCFMCLSNGVWQVVPRSVVVPSLDVEYELRAYLQKETGLLNYVLCEPTGRQVPLMTVALEPGLFAELVLVEVVGVGRVTDLAGRFYSTELLRIDVDFDPDTTLYPGTNFEATAANGHITFAKLWETDRTNGQISVILRDKYGLIIGRRRISFAGIDEGLDFKYYIEGLTPGERYSVDVVADIRGIGGDTSARDGLMARVVTNACWTTDGWVRENARTYAGEEAGSGVWTPGGVEASVTDGCISFNSSACEADEEHLHFAATNELPSHTGFEYRTTASFDSSATELPSITGPFGLTILGIRDPSTEEVLYCQFAVLTNGVWTTVDTGIYEPRTGVEYELTLHADFRARTAYYAIQSARDRQPVILVAFPLAESCTRTPFATEFYGVGRIRTHEGDGFDTRVIEVAPEIVPFEPGTNFAETVVSGILRIRQLWLTDKTDGTFTINVRDAHGAFVTSATVPYHSVTNQDLDLSVLVDGLVPGQVYEFEVVTTLEDEEVGRTRPAGVMARKVGTWISEDPATFAHEKVGTGDWLNTNETTQVVGAGADRAIRVAVLEGDAPVGYHPTNDTLSVRKSTVREIRFAVDFELPGWYASSADPPSFGTNLLAAATVWCDDTAEREGEYDTALAVVTTNGAWTVLEETRNRYSATEPCTVVVLIDQKFGYVRYELQTATATNRLYQYDFEPTGPRNLDFGFIGTGRVRAVDGDAWDPNLITTATDEYEDLNRAISATGADDVLSPLWRANQLVTALRGSFTVYDPKKWLTVRFPAWYYVVVEGDGDTKVYRFNSSNNWIDYAKDGPENVETNGTLFIVHTPEGLSWIAALATNDWVSGRIELATNIDLKVHNWTPIAGFSGEFDGRGWTIDGLNNTNYVAGVPESEYLRGPTNRWGRSTYGLFGTATNATLANVTFTDVAISNLADSVAALVGALAGEATVSNVTVESGSVLGAGGTVAGLAGSADFTRLLAVVSSTNRADVTAESAVFGEGRYAAGLLCVAGPTDPSAPLGTVVVTNNVNTGLIAGTLYDFDLAGGNLAQILAGTTRGARFGDVQLTNNLAAGAVDALLVQSGNNSLVATNFPAVNLAPAYWGTDENGDFLRALDANEPGAVAVDPYLRTARMLSGQFPNGAENTAGLINDRITLLVPGETLALSNGFESWAPIRLDRDIVFDLSGHTNFTIYINNTFVISEGVHPTVKNGTIVVGQESEAFSGPAPATENLSIVKVDADFYSRTTLLINGEFSSVLDLPLEALNVAGTVIQIFKEETDLTVDLATGSLCLGGVPFAQLSDDYAFSLATDADGNLVYRVHLADTAANMPTAKVSVGPEGVRVTVGNTRAGMTYSLQRKASLVEKDWSSVGSGVAATADNEEITLAAPTDGAQGYYRVLATETPQSE